MYWDVIRTETGGAAIIMVGGLFLCLALVAAASPITATNTASDDLLGALALMGVGIGFIAWAAAGIYYLRKREDERAKNFRPFGWDALPVAPSELSGNAGEGPGASR